LNLCSVDGYAVAPVHKRICHIFDEAGLFKAHNRSNVHLPNNVKPFSDSEFDFGYLLPGCKDEMHAILNVMSRYLPADMTVCCK
jgi:hypothetical protein